MISPIRSVDRRTVQVFAPSSTLEDRFTRDGSAGLEDNIQQICRRVLTDIRKCVPGRKLQAVLLGGGYGRGEGGVFRKDGEDLPFNDLEFYIFISGLNWLNEKQYGATLHRLGLEAGAHAGIDVDFKILSLEKLRHSGSSMFYHDLAVGHKSLHGPKNLLDWSAHHLDAGNIPLSEAVRLLMNRCTGLLFVKERTGAGSWTTGFAERNLAKLRLALGDVLLTAQGCYHGSCVVRGERVQRLQHIPGFPSLTSVQRHHQSGVEFKLHPGRSLDGEQEARELFAGLSDLALQVWLWLEHRRLGGAFASAREYALSSIDKCPETKAFRNWAVNSIRFGPAMAWRAKSLRYPRERLLNTLPVLLWEPPAKDDPALLNRLQEQLRTTATDPASLVLAYTKLWERFR